MCKEFISAALAWEYERSNAKGLSIFSGFLFRAKKRVAGQVKSSQVKFKFKFKFKFEFKSSQSGFLLCFLRKALVQ